MTKIFADYTATISELKKSPSTVIEKAGEEVIAILNHNRPTAYLIPSGRYEAMVAELGRYRGEVSGGDEKRMEDWDGCDA